MKPAAKIENRSSPGKRRGFALVVTLTLMVLLSILALGMLTLSSVSLRTVSRTDAKATARANALLALQLAIGELQTHLGPDQRISANAKVLGDSVVQPKITGVWESNKLDTQSTAVDFEKGEKTKRFRKWLVSGTDQTLLETEGFANQSPGTADEVVELVTRENLEADAPVITAAKVSLPGNSAGSYAYAVIDEGVKARINMGTKKPGDELAEKSTKLGSGDRPGLKGVEGVTQIPADDVDLTTPEGRRHVAKMVSMRTAELSYKTELGEFTHKSHDFTTHSTGVLANVADGGLKTDLNLLAETQNGGTLPAGFATDGIYQKELGDSPKPDPRWSRALGWANLFNTDTLTERTVGGIDLPTATATAPESWYAGKGVAPGSGVNPGSASLSGIEPPAPVLLPNIAKIQMSFALAARDVYDYPLGSNPPPDTSPALVNLHNPFDGWYNWDTKTKKKFDSPVDYVLHLIYSPVITLHNPYNVPLHFENLRVEFVNVPFALKIYRNGIAQTNDFVPFALMADSRAVVGASKRFGLLISNTLLPGEVKVFSANIDPNRTWKQEQRSGGKSGLQFFDWANQSAEDGRTPANASDTSRATAVEGWNGVSVGYDVAALCATSARFGTDDVNGATINRGVNIPLKLTDTIHAEYKPLPDPNLPDKKFSVEMTLNFQTQNLSEWSAKERSTAYVFEYGGYEDLEKALMDEDQLEPNGVLRWPKGLDQWPVGLLFDHAQIPLKEMANVQPIALFTAYAKTGLSGSQSSGSEYEDGLWPAKPFSFQNQSAVAIQQNLETSTPAHYSQELSLTQFPSNGLGVNADTGRGKFLSGHSEDTGANFGTLFEVPLAPFQSLVSLNSAQLAAGTRLPHFFAPVGNSYVHPLMTGSLPVEPGLEGTDYADHSFLLNASLFDRFYLSGMQSHATSSRGGDGKTADDLIESFMASADPDESTSSQLPDTRLRAHLSGGETPDEAIAILKNRQEGYKAAAARQLVDGAFNVNSTSVAAWRAMLSSMDGTGAPLFNLPETVSTSEQISRSELDEQDDPDGARFSRLRIPGGQPDREDEDGFWRGPIDIDSAQLDSLAAEIVAQVKLRGPFLSVAEFVNRQLGNAQSDDLAFSGAIQSAIDRTNINTGISVAAEAGYEIDESAANGLSLRTPAALAGESTQGAPGYLMQADILAVLGNAVAVRSDTFTIRAYGEAVDNDGNVTARSYCEAVVQRMPEFVDSSDAAQTPIGALTSNANTNFGRRFQILSLRWLSPSEI